MAACRYLSDHFTAIVLDTRVLVCRPVIFFVSFRFDRAELFLPPVQSAATIKRAQETAKGEKKRNSKIDR